MKKILLLLTALCIISSCTLEPDDPTYNVEFLAAEQIIYPTAVVPGRTYTVIVGFTKPNACYMYDKFTSEKDADGSIIIALQARVLVDGQCKNYENGTYNEQSFKFSCDETYTSANNYTFKFFTGYDVEGNKTYKEIVIPVR